FPDEPAARDAGFTFHFPNMGFKSNTSGVSLAFQLASGARMESERIAVPFLLSPGCTLPKVASLSSPGYSAPPTAPFPVKVLELIRELRGGDFACGAIWSDEQIKSGVVDIILLAQRGSRCTSGLFSYLSYLKAVRSHSDFVARYFPR